MIAYHGNPAIKERHLWRVCERLELRQYSYGSDFHAQFYESVSGIPAILAYLEYAFSDDLQPSVSWIESFHTAIPVGADLSGVWPRFAVWLLDNLEGNAVVQEARSLYERLIEGENVPDWEFRAIEGSEGKDDALSATFFIAHAQLYPLYVDYALDYFSDECCAAGKTRLLELLALAPHGDASP